MSAPKAPCTFAKSGGGLKVQLVSRVRYRSGRFLEVILGTETEAFFDVVSSPPLVSIWYPFGMPLGGALGRFWARLGPESTKNSIFENSNISKDVSSFLG